MRRVTVSCLRAASFVVLAATVVAPAAAAKPRPTPSDLSTRESLRQSLVYRARGPAVGMTMRETRRLRATLNVLLPDLDPAAVTANTYVGLRIGDWKFERPVSFDRAWKPGKTRANFRVASSDPKRPGFTTVKADWSGGVLGIAVVSTSEAPVCASDVAAATGSVTSSIDGAARFGDQHVHLGGTATGTMTRKTVPVLDSSADLARVSLVGRADVVGDAADKSAPVVVITLPLDGSTRAPGTVHVAGTMRDDRAIRSVSYVLDFGVETEEPFALDLSSGYLEDVRGTFAFDVPGTPGVHSVVVYAKDVAGNSGFARTSFLVPQSGVVALRTSTWETMAVDDKARLQKWGYPVSTPTVVTGLASIRAVGPNLGVLGDGTVTTLSGDPAGATPTGTSARVQVQGLADIADVAAGDGGGLGGGSFGLALRSDGVVLAWGANAVGQLGDGTTTPHYPPAPVPGLPFIRAIAAGNSFAVALDDSGHVWTWGLDGLVLYPNFDATPRQVVGPTGVSSIAAGGSLPVAYAVATDGTAWNWGLWPGGQLAGAVGTQTGWYQSPGTVPGLRGIRQAAVGDDHVLLAMSDGTVLACGDGSNGQLGDGTKNSAYVPRPVPGLTDVVSVAAGRWTSFAVLADGTIRAFGYNGRESLGDGTFTDRLSPVAVALSQ